MQVVKLVSCAVQLHREPQRGDGTVAEWPTAGYELCEVAASTASLQFAQSGCAR